MGLKYACVRGQSAVDCGPAALATVARHYGLRVRTTRLEELIGTDLQGAGTTGLRRAAEQLGFTTALGKTKPGALDEIPLPAIAHFNDTPVGHFVVVHKVAAGKVVVADPARGVLTLPRDEFLARWSRTVLLLKPSPDFRPGDAGRSPLRRLLSLALGERRLLGYSLACALIMSLLGFGSSLFVQLVIDRVVPFSDLSLLHILLAAFLLVLAFRALYSFIRQCLLAHAGFRIEVTRGLGYVSHVLSLPTRFFDRRSTGDVYSRLSDVTSIQAAIVGALLTVFTDIVLLASLTALMAWYNLRLTLVALCFLPLLGAVTLLLNRPLITRQREVRRQVSLVSNRFIEAIVNVRILKVFTAERAAYERVEEHYLKLQEVMLRRSILSGLLGITSNFLTGAAALILLSMGARLVMDNHLSIGQLMFFFAVAGYFLGPVDRLANSVAMIQDAIIGVERLDEIQSVEPERPAQSHLIEKAEVRGRIEFQNVSFHYREGYPVLADVNLTIEPGQVVVIVGETGSGKTSLANLVTGLYQPTGGRILIDGHDVQDFDPDALRGRIGVVFQDPSLMSGTVFENIALGAPRASAEAVKEAALLAAADGFIMALPKRYDYEVGDRGLALSSGQRQRIAIARALLRDPAILILDEATGNLDCDTEREVIDNVRLSGRERTTMIITHRLNVAARADLVVVLDGGRIVEAGTHRELMGRKGKYLSLWLAQGPKWPPYLADEQEQDAVACEYRA